MTRHEQREHLFLLLFRTDFYDEDGRKEQEELYFSDELSDASERERDDIRIKYHAILTKLSELDHSINERTEGWKTSRMGKVELTILRIAVYEISEDPDVPTGVAINEAVELAKAYGPDSASAFVNGVLAKFA